MQMNWKTIVWLQIKTWNRNKKRYKMKLKSSFDDSNLESCSDITEPVIVLITCRKQRALSKINMN